MDKLIKQTQTLFKQAKAITIPIDDSLFQCDVLKLPQTLDLNKSESQKQYRNVGIELLQQGRVSIVMVAGGVSTRMNISGLRGDLPVGPVTQRSLFRLQSEKIAAIKKRYAPEMIWLVMTSQEVHKETEASFKKENYYGIDPKDIIFFDQESLPVLDSDGNPIIFKGQYLTSPVGHGGMLGAFKKFKYWDRLKNVSYLFYFQYPNVLEYICDPAMIGFHHENQFDVTTKGFKSYQTDEKLGRIVYDGDNFRIIEYHCIDQNCEPLSAKLTKLPANAGTHIWSKNFIEHCLKNDIVLPYYELRHNIDAFKDRCPTKLESFIFDLLPFAKSSGLVISKRSQTYAAVKQKSGYDSITKARKALVRQYNEWLKAAQATSDFRNCLVEINPDFALDAIELRDKLPSNFKYRYGDIIDSNGVKPSPINETIAIATIKDRLGSIATPNKQESFDIVVSMSDKDDAALIDIKQASSIVVSSDYIRGRQFDLYKQGHLNYFDLGYYLVCANLSDLAAMGAMPLGLSLILRYDEKMTCADFAMVVDGVKAACNENGSCPVLGGDTGGATDLVLSATAIGKVVGKPLLRSNAKPGDKVFFAGYPGRARSAMILASEMYNKSLPKEMMTIFDICLNQWRKPKPLLTIGSILSKSSCQIACQDGSDGIKDAVQKIAESSNANIILTEKLLNIDDLLIPMCEYFKLDPLDIFLGASVDFGLIFTLPPDVDHNAITFDTPVVQIGSVVPGSGEVKLLQKNGRILNQLPGADYTQ